MDNAWAASAHPTPTSVVRKNVLKAGSAKGFRLKSPPCLLPLMGFVRGAVYDFVRPRHGQCGDEEAEMDKELPHHHLLRQAACVDKGLQQVDGRNADDGHGQLHFQHGMRLRG